MKILSPYREKKFKAIPKFSKDARSVYLLPDAKTNKTLNRLNSNEAKVGYLVRRAYFRAKGGFYPIVEAATADIRAAKALLGIKASLDFSKYTAKTASYHRNLILNESEWSGYKTDAHRKQLEEHAALLVDKLPNREDLLFSLLDYCWRRRIEIPSYTEFSTIVSNSFNLFHEKIKKTLSCHINSTQKEKLLSLVRDPSLSKKLRYLKVINQSTKTFKLRDAADDLSLFRELYLELHDLADRINLTKEAQQHFSKIVKDTTISGLKKLKDEDDLAIKLLGFTQDQFHSRNDAAILSILKYMREKVNEAGNYEKKLKEKESEALENATESVAVYAKTEDLILEQIKLIHIDSSLTNGEKSTKTLQLIEAHNEAINPNLNNHIASVMRGMEVNKKSVRKVIYLFENSIKIQRAITPLVKLLIVDTENSDNKISNAIQYFIETDGNVKQNDAPIDFLNTTELNLLTGQKSFSFSEKYKALLFWHIEKAVRGKRLNFLYSHIYQPAHKLQISDTLWTEKYEELLKAAELWEFRDGEQVLKSTGKKTTEIILKVNKQIENGENPYVTVKNGEWNLQGYDAEFDTTQYIPSLLKGSKKILLYKALAELDEEIQFSDEFMLPDQAGALTKLEKKYIYGVLISLGTNIGHLNLAQASSLEEKMLRDIDTKRFTVEKLRKVNRAIVKQIQSLDLTKIYEEEEDLIHSSSDGKKIVVAVDSLLANYSYKYYGKEQGISANSFVDNKQSFFHVNVLSSSDREAAYMIDGLVRARENIYEDNQKDPFIQELDNETFNKRTHQHSTDTFGYTDAAFSGLFFLNVSFAPRIKDITNATLHGFEHKYIKSQSNLPILPNRAITKSLILDNWDDILRFMATIKLGYASASTLFRMLSAKGDSTLYKALKEFGKLLKTQFIYAYMEDVTLRQRIQKQLNRAELGQRFKN